MKTLTLAIATLVLIAGRAQGQANPDPKGRLCEAVQVAADQLDRNGHYMVAERGNALDQNDQIKDAFEPQSGAGSLAKVIAKTNTDRAAQYAAVAKDDFALASTLRLEFRHLCR